MITQMLKSRNPNAFLKRRWLAVSFNIIAAMVGRLRFSLIQIACNSLKYFIYTKVGNVNSNTNIFLLKSYLQSIFQVSNLSSSLEVCSQCAN